MREQVRAIYRAATGSDLIETEAAEEAEVPPLDEVALRFANLEAMARNTPGIAERVPPFSFTPMVDLIECEKEWLVEAAVPAAEQDSVSVEISGDVLTISGTCRGSTMTGCAYLHAEIPRGPFHRRVQMPHKIEGKPRVEVQRGLVSIHLPKGSKAEARGARRSAGRGHK